MARDSDRADQVQRGHRSVKALFMAFLAPWLGWVLLFPVAVVARLEWGGRGNETTGVAFLLVGLTLAMMRLTRELTKSRGRVVRELAMGSAAAGGLWLVAAMMFAPWAHPWLDLWQFGGAIPLGWNAYRALSHAKDGAAGGMAGKLIEVIGQAKVHKVKPESTRLGTVVHADLEVVRGEQTIKDLQGKAEHLETLLGLRPGSVVITGDGDDAGHANLLVIPTDTLREPVLWPGPSKPGASIIEPIECGAYLDARPVELILPGSEQDARNLAHILLNGVPGAGKSQTVCEIVCSVLCRTEVVVIGSDPVKGLQSFGPFIRADALELVATDLGTSKLLLAAVKRSIKARADFLGAKGLKQWEPGCGLSFLIVWLEEATWATQSGVLSDISAQARSTGIQLIVSQQRSSYDTTDTTLRSNLTAGISGGLASSMDAKFNLPDWLVDLVGDTLEAWGTSKPGYMVACHPSIPEADQPKPWRSFKTTDDEIEAALRRWAHVRSSLDATTRGALGDTYDKIKAVMSGATPPPAVTGDIDDYPDDDTDEDDVDADEDDMPDEEREDTTEVDDDMGIRVDPRQPVSPLPSDIRDIPMGGPRPNLSRMSQAGRSARARGVVQQHLRTLLAAGTTTLGPSDIARMRPETGMSVEWVRLELIRLCQEPEPGDVCLDRTFDGPINKFTMLVSGEPAEHALTGSTA